MQDPPTKVEMIPLYGADATADLQIHFKTPTQRDNLALYPVLIGASSDITKHLFKEMGFSLFFAGVLLMLSFVLYLIALVMIRIEKGGIAFFYLGLFSMLTGLWVACECNLTGLFIENAVLLYLLDFIGLFTLSIPLLRFGLVLMDLRNRTAIRIMCIILEISVCAALLLQFSGIVPFSKSMYLFHILIPLALCVFGICILSDAIKHKNIMARRFLIPIGAVAVCSILEALNYYLFRTEIHITMFFQIGVLLFLVTSSILCGLLIRDALKIKTKNSLLAYEMTMIEKQMELQKQYYLSLAGEAEDIRMHRHDFKHHLAVIREYNISGDREKLSEYLDELQSSIPEPSVTRFCDNDAVNAIIGYYHDIALSHDIKDIDIKLDIPKDTCIVPSSDICIMLGNMMENAIHACVESQPGPSFIRIQSRRKYDILTVTMDNSYAFVKSDEKGNFMTTKKCGGLGLKSITSIAKRYGGDTEFKALNGVFSASAYLHLK